MEIFKCTISFIWLLGYLVPPQWERGRDKLLGVHIEHIRKQKNVWNVIIEGGNKMEGKGADSQLKG
jgi:hypothetical protein